MKKIITIPFLAFLFVLSIGKTSHAQQEWGDLPTNPDILPGAPFEIEIVNGVVYQFYNQFEISQNRLFTYHYDQTYGVWRFDNFYASTAYTKIITHKIDSTVYLVSYDGASFGFLKYTYPQMFPENIVQNYTVSNVNDNWEFEVGTGDEELYLLYTIGTGPSDIYGLERNPGFTWLEMTQNSTQDLSLADLQIQTTDTKVYFGVFSNKVEMRSFNKGFIAGIVPYDGNLGEVFSDGTNWNNSGFAIVGNKNDYVAFYGTEDLNNLSYEVPIVNGTQIDINTSSDPTTTFNLSSSNLTKESSLINGYVFSMFSPDGLGNPNDKLEIIKRDFSQGGSLWANVGGGLLEPQGTAIEPKSVVLSINNSNERLVSAYKLLGQNDYTIKILNNNPVIVSSVVNSGLCADQLNEIYSQIEISDVDFDQVRITNAYSLNSLTTNISFYGVGYLNGVSKFKILGNPTSTLDQIVIEYTDGFNQYTANLSSFIANTTPLNIDFISNPVKFCSNEVELDLASYVTYYDQGIFRINTLDILGSQIDAFSLNSIFSTGIIRFTQNVNGCIITKTSAYEIVDAPSASTTTTPSSCAENTGTATATVTLGTSTNITKYWSTGETTNSISNLNPGAYYFNVIDGNNCKATTLAAVLSNDITMTGTVNNISCFGESDGNISVSVTGATAYQIVWSNGFFGNNLTNVPANTYECTLYDSSGCQTQSSFTITQAPKLDLSFVSNSPNCNFATGGIVTTISGGTPNYNILWNTGATSNNLLNLSQGFYQITVTDAYSCIIKDSIYLNNDNSIEVSDSIYPTDCALSNGGIDLTITESILSGSVDSIKWSNGAVIADNFNLSEGNYLLTVNYGSNCVFQQSYFVGIRPPLRNDICIVTVDEETTTNLVVWEKNEVEGVTHFNIYRENSVAGNYDLIDTIQATNISVFNDVIASPLHRSWRYRISAVNSCGVESVLSIPHKTLHLNLIEEQTPGTFDIYWDDYEGISNGNYIVNRFTTQTGWEELSPTVPFGGVTMFTDTPPVGSLDLDYYVSFQLDEPCTATWRTENFNVSRSNKDKGIFNPGEGTDFPSNAGIELLSNEKNVSIFPNPFQNELLVKIDGKSVCEIEICDIHGKLVLKQICENETTTISTNDLFSGMYFINIEQGKENI